MPATVLCARATALIDHGPHSYGANQSWWCPGYSYAEERAVPGRAYPDRPWLLQPPDELPIEHELIDGAWYMEPEGNVLFEGTNARKTGVANWHRLGPVARYEAPAPEVKEPTGLGAVVRSADDGVFVRTIDDEWAGARCLVGWKAITQPVTVLSEGVEL